jgi:hypothetical protein
MHPTDCFKQCASYLDRFCFAICNAKCSNVWSWHNTTWGRERSCLFSAQESV